MDSKTNTPEPPYPGSDVNLAQCSAAVFLTDGSYLTTTDGLVALAQELIESVGSSAKYKVVKTSYAGLSLLGREVTRLVEAALRPDAPADLVESARQGIEGFLTLLEDREEDDISEVYAAITLLRIASAQFEVITHQQAFTAPEDEDGARKISAQRTSAATGDGNQEAPNPCPDRLASAAAEVS